MDPTRSARRARKGTAPRAPRGWTPNSARDGAGPSLLPAPAGQDPRCRRWTARGPASAPAGMDPRRTSNPRRSRSAPRARGDELGTRNGRNARGVLVAPAVKDPRRFGCRVSYCQRTRGTNLTARAQSEETGAAWPAIVRSGESRSVPDAFGAQAGSGRGTVQPTIPVARPSGTLMELCPCGRCRAAVVVGARVGFRSSRFMRSAFRACSVTKGRGRNRRRRCPRPRGDQRLIQDLQRRPLRLRLCGGRRQRNPTAGQQRRGDDTVRYGTAAARPLDLGVGGRCARSHSGIWHRFGGVEG
jgi:hypothetical protein